MILLGDEHIEFECIVKVSSIEDIKNTPPNSTVAFSFDMDILKYTNQNEINCAIKVDSIKELIYANLLNAKYIIPNKSILKDSQKIADNYMFDSKVLALINEADEIEKLALDGIDGAIYEKLLNKE